ncbi:MAG: hypothetical protein AAFX85_20005 [Pseudomonadota bacterium]
MGHRHATPWGARLLVFYRPAALACAQAAAREKKGLHADVVDMMLAGIVKIAGAALATRNTTDFQGCDIARVAPWLGKQR